MNFSIFTKRSLEQAAVAFLGGFAASLVASDSLARAAIVAGLAAGARAVYGLLVRMVGTSDTPSAL